MLNPVGARLAREAFDVLEDAIASRLAPTLDLQRIWYLCTAKNYCGSEPARDGGIQDAAILKA
jgi:hypothetical protein